MIKLSKSAKPDVLSRKSAEWTKAVLDKLARGESPTKSDRTHYSHPNIKAAIVAETSGKCAYCESKVRHISHGDIEHIVPKSVVPERWYDWENLTQACDVCNENKSDFHGNHNTFVDPYTGEPETQFWFMGPVIFSSPGSEAAAITERVLDLNRGALLERRTERLRGLMKLLEVIQGTNNLALKDLLKEDFLAETAADKEYAALAREVVRTARARSVLPAESTSTND